MKTTAKILIGLISTALFFFGAPSFADGWPTGTETALGRAAEADRSEEARRRCDDLLQRARQAMAENDLASADALVSQAEALGVEYGPFYRGDTPKRIRRDLDRQQKAAGTAPRRPSEMFSPLSLNKSRAAATDPFAARRDDAPLSILPDAKSKAKAYLRNGREELNRGDLTAAAYWHRQAAEQGATFGASEDSPSKLAAEILSRGGRLDGSAQAPGTPAAGNVTPLPPIDQATPLSPSAAGGANVASSGTAQSDPLLLAARRALAEGDVRRASDAVAKAKALRASYGPLDDSPAKVESLIRSYRDLVAQRTTQGESGAYRSQFARVLMEQAEGLLRHGDYERAESLATLAAQQGVAFAPYQPNPQELLGRIAAARRQGPGALLAAGVPAGQEVVPATGIFPLDRTASHAVYDQANDPTWNRFASVQRPTPAPAPPPPLSPAEPSGAGSPRSAAIPSMGQSLVQRGEAALMAHDATRAADYFRQAANYSDQLDAVTAQRLQERLQMLSAAAGAPAAPSMIDQAASNQRRLYEQVAVDVAHQESQANSMRQLDPKGALALLEQTRQKVQAAGLEPAARDRLLARLDRSLAEMQQYVEQNRARIELEEENQRTREEIERERQMKLDVQDKVALLVEEYNQLMRDERWAEAEVVAKRVAELDPENPLAAQLVEVARMTRRYLSNLDLRDARERGFWVGSDSVDEAAIPFDDRNPIVFRDAKEWEALTERRRAWMREGGRQRNPRELEIEQKLRTPILLEFNNAPLSQVMDYLARMAAVNLHLDPEGMAEMGVTSDDPVTINLGQEVSLQSALNLILEPRHLTYLIKDEVLKITSEDQRQGEVYQRVYNVADLVMPIPNFEPSPGMGLAGAYHDAMGSIGFGGQRSFGGLAGPLAVVASRTGEQNSASVNPNVLAQMPTGQMGTTPPMSMPVGFGGPGGLGGGTMADFDTLIELITTTVAPETWEDVGGAGSIAPFPTNLSLVISQTQEVHDQIVDLLEQLRRLQDLQVTIEVRFITLNDNFFERIGIDFDFDIDDDIDRPFQVFGREIPDTADPETGVEPARNTLDVDHDRSLTVGLSQPGVFSADLDIPFTQNHFGVATPQFGGYDPTAAASFGFAILSDIEAFFFVEAASGDRRSNVLQAPKVTLFNGQQAFISDTSQSPFVISVIPVVGDFAAAQQPVIVVLSEGTFLTVQAVASDDRRFVRLTVIPFFSRIGDVDTFTFEGSETTTENSSEEGNQDEPDENTSSSSGRTTSRSGTTVQLPTFSFVTVTTTVSVPDGGTVLLGGIKRLAEGRNEFGVPMLKNLPYVNRLFKNVGIGRETQSLMMMVTPRIIIQEEEEEQLGILAP